MCVCFCVRELFPVFFLLLYIDIFICSSVLRVLFVNCCHCICECFVVGFCYRMFCLSRVCAVCVCVRMCICSLASSLPHPLRPIPTKKTCLAFVYKTTSVSYRYISCSSCLIPVTPSVVPPPKLYKPLVGVVSGGHRIPCGRPPRKLSPVARLLLHRFIFRLYIYSNFCTLSHAALFSIHTTR